MENKSNTMSEATNYSTNGSLNNDNTFKRT